MSLPFDNRLGQIAALLFSAVLAHRAGATDSFALVPFEGLHLQPSVYIQAGTASSPAGYFLKVADVTVPQPVDKNPGPPPALYTKEQAKKGLLGYLQNCASCHGPALDGLFPLWVEKDLVGRAPPAEAISANTEAPRHDVFARAEDESFLGSLYYRAWTSRESMRVSKRARSGLSNGQRDSPDSGPSGGNPCSQTARAIGRHARHEDRSRALPFVEPPEHVQSHCGLGGRYRSGGKCNQLFLFASF